MRTNIIRNVDVWSLIFQFFPFALMLLRFSESFAEDIYKSVKADRQREQS